MGFKEDEEKKNESLGQRIHNIWKRAVLPHQNKLLTRRIRRSERRKKKNKTPIEFNNNNFHNNDPNGQIV